MVSRRRPWEVLNDQKSELGYRGSERIHQRQSRSRTDRLRKYTAEGSSRSFSHLMAKDPRRPHQAAPPRSMPQASLPSREVSTVSRKDSISAELFSPPPIHHLELLEKQNCLQPEKLKYDEARTMMPRSSIWESVLIQATEIKRLLACQDSSHTERRLSAHLLSRSQPCPKAKFLPER